MAERRLCPDTVRPEPKLEFRNGKVADDFTEFDKAAAYYLEELKLPHFYTPWFFYGFGWGHPPHKLSGAEPFPLPSTVWQEMQRDSAKIFLPLTASPCGSAAAARIRVPIPPWGVRLKR